MVTAYRYYFKTRLGYFTVGLSLSITCHRQKIARSETQDYLAITVHVRGMDRGTVRLQDAIVIISDADERSTSNDNLSQTKEPISLNDIFRYAHVKNETDIPETKGRGYRFKITPRKYAHHNPLLSIAPGEEVNWGCVTRVTKDRAYVVEVVVLGSPPETKTRFKDITGQWRASCISLPIQIAEEVR
jgi:hypothetical protein